MKRSSSVFQMKRKFFFWFDGIREISAENERRNVSSSIPKVFLNEPKIVGAKDRISKENFPSKSGETSFPLDGSRNSIESKRFSSPSSRKNLSERFSFREKFVKSTIALLKHFSMRKMFDSNKFFCKRIFKYEKR